MHNTHRLVPGTGVPDNLVCRSRMQRHVLPEAHEPVHSRKHSSSTARGVTVAKHVTIVNCGGSALRQRYINGFFRLNLSSAVHVWKTKSLLRRLINEGI
jgi:hypothetical protein